MIPQPTGRAFGPYDAANLPRADTPFPDGDGRFLSPGHLEGRCAWECS
ncbi:hypothetical protein [Kitasatospora aureofaciens]